MPLPYLACMLAAAQFYHLPPRVLPSIQVVEGGFPGAIHPNRDGSDDLGVMQINTRWIGPLTGYVNAQPGSHMTEQSMHDRLITDPCFNISAAALIVHYEWTGAGGDWLRAVGNYHSHTPSFHAAYLARVTAAARALFGP
jgi:hypothetical protein